MNDIGNIITLAVGLLVVSGAIYYFAKARREDKLAKLNQKNTAHSPNSGNSRKEHIQKGGLGGGSNLT